MKPGQMKKFIATAALLWLFLASTEMSPVLSHTVLGTLDGNPPYFRKNDHELNPKNPNVGHVPGPLAHLWPGGGSNRYLEDSSFPPGYQSPFQDFEKPGQAASCQYSPEAGILASSTDREVVGDFIIGLNFSQPKAFPSPLFVRYWSIVIYIPAPCKNRSGVLEQDGFEPVGVNWDIGENTNIVTTLTDSYGNISVTRAGALDPFGPNWWMIRIGSGGKGMVFTEDGDEWYYVRINQMRVPVIAGRYLFKIFLDDHYPVRGQNDPGNLISGTMPAENWPVVLVKGDTDPAIAYGTIRYGGPNQTLYGTPLQIAGKVRLAGVAMEPASGLVRGRTVEARGYFNASSKGHYEVEGVSPGIYDAYVSAAGFPEQRLGRNIVLCRGQSLALDFYLRPGIEVRGEVFSKSIVSTSNWVNQLPISIVIYESDDYKESSIATYSPINLTHAPFTSYVQGNTIFDKDGLKAPSQPKLVAFPWEGPLSYYSYTSLSPDSKDPYAVFNGVGPAQTWWVSPHSAIDPETGLGSTESAFLFQFGTRTFYGAPARLSGMVPQIFATWIDGLQPRTYFVRAYVHGYVQTTADGGSFRDYPFKVASIEHDASVCVQMDLYRAGMIEVTVHFHDSPGTRQESSIGGPDPTRYMIVEAFGHVGQASALNFTTVASSSSSASINIAGFGMAGALPTSGSGTKYSLLRYRAVRDYGLPTGSYAVRAYVRGYVQAPAPGEAIRHLDVAPVCTVSMSSCSKISLHMYRGGGINASVRSVDWQLPSNPRNWSWNNTQVSTLVYDMASRTFVDVVYFWNSSANSWSLPRTNSKFSMIPWPSWKSKFGSGASFLMTNGSAILERYGPALPNPKSIALSKDVATSLFLENVARASFLFNSALYRSSDFKSNVAIYPGEYCLTAWTYGYVQEGVHTLGDLGRISVAVGAIGSHADSNIQLMRGADFNITVIFRKEGILEGTPYNSSARIRVYDDTDSLVAAASTSLEAGTINLESQTTGFFADQKKITQAGGKISIPKGTKILEYKNLAGLYRYTELLSGIERVQALKRAQLFSLDCGVWGSVDERRGYHGSWTVRMDLVNWYPGGKQFHPAPAGLLQGESSFLFHYNHLGPYEQNTSATIPNVALSGKASITIAMDRRAYVRGHIYRTNWFDEVRTEAWATVEMREGRNVYRTYSFDGFYDAYLPQGRFELRVSLKMLPARETAANRTIFISDGANVFGEDFFLGSQDIFQGTCSPESAPSHMVRSLLQFDARRSPFWLRI